MNTHQLDLFGSPEARSLKAENAWLRERLDRAKDAYRALREDRDTVLKSCDALVLKLEALQAEIGRHRQDLDKAQTQARYWKGACELERLCRAHIPTRAPTLEPTLKQLLTLAHPDKWSQGQPATVLAHELSVALNALRERGEVT